VEAIPKIKSQAEPRRSQSDPNLLGRQIESLWLGYSEDSGSNDLLADAFDDSLCIGCWHEEQQESVLERWTE
jgi:hypothetical protein